MDTFESTERFTNKYTVDNRDIPLLEVKNLSLSFRQYQTGLRESQLQVIRNLDLIINEGEIVAVVGASGSGKSLLANAILGVLPKNAILDGTLRYKGEQLTRSRQKRLRGKEISLIPQSVNALDPLMKSGKQVQAVIKEKRKKAVQQDIFQKVGLSPEVGERYPFELSGGMARRVLVTTAMVSGAELVIADEPTPGLDQKAVHETIDYLKQLAIGGKGIMFITHDIDTALQVADEIVVFYAGQTVEIANVEDFSGKGDKLRHPYTKALWNALPQNEFKPLSGSQPFLGEVMNGCVFQKRCPVAMELCTYKQPDLQEASGGAVRCFDA